MSTKGQRKQVERRRARSRESFRPIEDAPDRDTTLGRTMRRGWGAGKAK